MRHKILMNELEDSQKSLQKIIKRKVGVRSFKDMLLKKRKEMEEELALINEHLKEQEMKEGVAEEEEKATVAQIKLIQKTLGDVEDELEKAKMLAMGSGMLVEEEGWGDVAERK